MDIPERFGDGQWARRHGHLTKRLPCAAGDEMPRVPPAEVQYADYAAPQHR
jgi:hypothetical protein